MTAEAVRAAMEKGVPVLAYIGDAGPVRVEQLVVDPATRRTSIALTIAGERCLIMPRGKDRLEIAEERMDRNRMDHWNQDSPAFDEDWGDELPAPGLLGYAALIGGVVLICGLIWLFCLLCGLDVLDPHGIGSGVPK